MGDKEKELLINGRTCANLLYGFTKPLHGITVLTEQEKEYIKNDIKTVVSVYYGSYADTDTIYYE